MVIRRALHTVANVCKGFMVGNNLGFSRTGKEVPGAKTFPFILGAAGTNQDFKIRK